MFSVECGNTMNGRQLKQMLRIRLTRMISCLLTTQGLLATQVSLMSTHLDHTLLTSTVLVSVLRAVS